MPEVKVKICGLRRAEDIAYVNELQPDFIGFVFAKSKRQVTPKLAAELKAQLAPEIKAVGVFVNAEIDFILQLAKAQTIDIIQLHGDEDAAYCAKLKQLINLPLIKAVRVKDAGSLAGVNELACDYLLFDTYTPGQYGGTGKRFDLSLADKDISKPYFVAGGLEAANAAAVLAQTKAFAVDVSGGVETDGVKDKKKIVAFIASVRGETK